EPIVREKLRPGFVYREAEVELAPDGVWLSGMDVPLTGNDVRRHLDGCDRVILLAATASAEADKLIRQASVAGMADALAVDCLCSAAIEQICDLAEEEIFSRINVPYRTWRFSPGYGDLPLDLQKPLLKVLNAQRRIGLTVTDSLLMVPSKSVTAIIGISENELHQKGSTGCDSCNMRDRCAFSARGGCGKN
ncbi:MAG TPA: vitamin B12 dependent-methionine synthase activation domain-containing protein, partial [Ruminococcus sp.]|nr:vitamin B12 dependent-methionine synthase activation domain-containing protein [Ruminococcus sp.]